MSGITGAVQVTAGGDACALLFTGQVECWGVNAFGGLGDGTASGPEICTDYEFPCSSTRAKRRASPMPSRRARAATTRVYCRPHAVHRPCRVLGRRRHGELGNGTTGDFDTPVEVTGITDAEQVSAGAASTCALLSSSRIECWGNNYFGDLGNGTTAEGGTGIDTPVDVLGPIGGSAFDRVAAVAC